MVWRWMLPDLFWRSIHLAQLPDAEMLHFDLPDRKLFEATRSD